jgi:hypothetical protein
MIKKNRWKKSHVQLKKYSTKLVNQDNLSYFDKLGSQTNPIETKEKENKYKAKFSTTSILKNKIDENKFEKKIITKKTKRKKKEAKHYGLQSSIK